jgi:hypothetical protein
VGWEEFLRVQQDVLTALSSLIAMADVQTRQLPDDVKGPARDIVGHYQDRLEAFYVLTGAIVAGDLAAEEDAGAAYNAISNPSVIAPLLERLFDAPTLRASLEAEGVTPEEMIAAIMGAIPNG